MPQTLECYVIILTLVYRCWSVDSCHKWDTAMKVLVHPHCLSNIVFLWKNRVVYAASEEAGESLHGALCAVLAIHACMLGRV